MYYVSRQCVWPDGNLDVEIAVGGIDYSGADAFVTFYKKEGEGIDYTDPREAVTAAINVYNAWKKDRPDYEIYLDGHEYNEDNIKALQGWAHDEYNSLPKCGHCGEILNLKDRDICWFDYDPDTKFCDSTCADNEEYENNRRFVEVESDEGDYDPADDWLWDEFLDEIEEDWLLYYDLYSDLGYDY